MKILFAILLGLFPMKINLVAQTDIWVAAYWAEWAHAINQNNLAPSVGRNLMTSEVDWSAFTHLIHHAVSVADSNTCALDLHDSTGFTAPRIRDIVDSAHSSYSHVKRPVLVGLGGYQDTFLVRAIRDQSHRTSLIVKMLAFSDTNNYDGWDIDLERGTSKGNGFDAGDTANFKAFIRQLYDSLKAPNRNAKWDPTKKHLLTSWYPAYWTNEEAYKDLMPYLDMLFMATYDFSGAYCDTGIVWHNSNMYDSAKTNLCGGANVLSVDGEAKRWRAIMDTSFKSKLGIGTEFKGYVWRGGLMTDAQGAQTPFQTWRGAANKPLVSTNFIYYWKIMDEMYRGTAYRWHNVVDAAYLTMNNSGTAQDSFVSYENQLSVQKRIDYIKNNKFGGIYIWELGSGYRRNLTTGLKDSMLQAVKEYAKLPLWAYQDDKLQSPWGNVSWSSTITLNSSEQKNAGTNSTKIVQAAGGAFSIHHGAQGSAGINITNYKALEFAVFPSASNFTLKVKFENDQGYVKNISYGCVKADQWIVATIPTSLLAPSNNIIHRISFMDSTGAARTFFLDDVKLIRTTGIWDPVYASWNMASVPESLSNFSKTAVWPTAISTAQRWNTQNAQYVDTDPLQFGQGYWVRFGPSQLIPYDGTRRYYKAIAVESTAATQWNLIGSISGSVSTCAIVQSPSGIVASSYFTYNNGYVTINTIEPGYGVWVKVNQSGTLTLKTSTAFPKTRSPHELLSALDQISVTDRLGRKQDMYVRNKTYPFQLSECATDHYELSKTEGEEVEDESVELPPDPPEEFFNVRFRTGNFVQVLEPSSETHLLPIDIKTAEYPVTLSWSLKDHHEFKYWMRSPSGERISLSSSGSVVVTNPEERAIQLEIEKGRHLFPEDYALMQNYPNPFNPSTTIHYALPKSDHVRLIVYDLLGREVFRLIDDVQDAGYKSVALDASGLSSGVYFYHLKAGRYSSTKKFVLIK